METKRLGVDGPEDDGRCPKSVQRGTGNALLCDKIEPGNNAIALCSCCQCVTFILPIAGYQSRTRHAFQRLVLHFVLPLIPKLHLNGVFRCSLLLAVCAQP